MVKNADGDVTDITITVGAYRRAKFAALLRSCGLSRAEFADRIGLRAATVARWGEKVPEYAVVYLELLERFRLMQSGVDIE